LKSSGVQTRIISLQNESDPEMAFIDAADSRTRLISVSSIQYASGLRLDIAKLGELCRTRDIAFCVDAIQGLGAFPHDVRAMHIDFLAADAHKWLLGPEGIALFYCRPEWRERLTLRQYGWHMVEAVGDYDRTDWQVAASARRFECGSQNMLGIYAFAASLSLLLEVGISEVERRILGRAERLFEAIASHRDLKLLTPTAPGRYGGIVTFSHRTRQPAELHTHLRTHHVVCAPRGGGIRFSPHCYTPLAQLDQAIDLAVASDA
jgi:selenocysteine lyase/cysteine desulfurase